MQAAQAIIGGYGQKARSHTWGPTGVLSGWLTRLFGCWHTDMSRPFTLEGESYRTCLDCGAHRKFDAMRWEMVGDYYYSAPQAS